MIMFEAVAINLQDFGILNALNLHSTMVKDFSYYQRSNPTTSKLSWVKMQFCIVEQHLLAYVRC